MKKCKYKIGDWVFVQYKREEKYLSIGEDWNRQHRGIIRTRLHTASWGQVVGCCRRIEGVRDYLGDDGWSFTAKKTYTFWEIKLGMLNRPIACAEEDFDYVAPPVPLQLPYSFQEQAPWSDQGRQDMREEAKKMPRDKKGRWVSALQVRNRSRLQEGDIPSS